MQKNDFNTAERMTIACALSMFLDNLTEHAEDDSKHKLAHIVALMSIISIVDKINLHEEMDEFAEVE